MSRNSQEKFKSIHNMFEKTENPKPTVPSKPVNSSNVVTTSPKPNAFANKLKMFNNDLNNNDEPNDGILPSAVNGPGKIPPKIPIRRPDMPLKPVKSVDNVENEFNSSEKPTDYISENSTEELSALPTDEGKDLPKASVKDERFRSVRPPPVTVKPKAKVPGKLDMNKFANIKPDAPVKPQITQKPRNLPEILKDQSNIQDDKENTKTKPTWKPKPKKFDISNEIASEVSMLALTKVSKTPSSQDHDKSDFPFSHACGLSPPNNLSAPPPISHPIIITRNSDSAKFEKLKFVPGNGSPPIKPRKIDVDLSAIIAEFKASLLSSLPGTDSQTADVEAVGRRSSANRPISLIPDMTEDEEEPADRLQSRSNLQSITEPEEEYQDCETVREEFEEIYEDYPEDDGPGSNIEQSDKKEPNKKELEKERKKKEKELRIQEAERKKEEKKEEKRRADEEKKNKKIFELTGEEREEAIGEAKIDTKGSNKELALKKGQKISIMRTMKNPPGTYLCQSEDKKWGYVNIQNLTINCDVLRQVMDKSKNNSIGAAADNSQNGFDDGQELYDDCAAAEDPDEIYEELG